jgi:tripartite motif-containing protein 71
LSSPQGIAVDSSSGNVYVVDTANNRIKKFSSNGTFITEWGRYGTGNGSLNSPRGIALDQAGNVYVADTGNNRIQVFSILKASR